ncbi:MAG TPA: hypothetical protein VK660_10735, partial [Xanthomonadaceae bacterium]|nr:hypothetical protein [Xanthomonadaceae bacterium]
MAIDIDRLSEAELIDLNHRIVERLRFMQQARAHVAMLQFRIGERVSFQPEGRERIVGIVARYNKKSVSVIAEDGCQWKVSPGLLSPESGQAATSRNPGVIVPWPGKR